MKEPLLTGGRERGRHVEGCFARQEQGHALQPPESHVDGPNDYGTPFPRLCFVPKWQKVLMFAILCVMVTLLATVWKVPFQECSGLSTAQMLKFLSLPVVSVLFTFTHIWGALWMTFYPIEFFGIKRCQIPESPWGLGWQGIVPSKAKKMSTTFIRTLTTQLVSLDELFACINPDILFDELEKPLAATIGQVLEEVGLEVAPKVWVDLPDYVRDELVDRVNEESPELMRTLLSKISEDVSHVFDIEEMVVKALCRDKPLINHMFLSCGFTELEFIRDTGAYMGLFLGVVQMIQQYYMPAGWLLPVFGVIGGLCTNWLALKMIFEPVNPTPIFGGRIVVQGQFLKRQHDVAADYSRIFYQNLGNARKLIPAIIVGSRRDHLCALIQHEVGRAVDRCAQVVQPLISLAGGQPLYERAKKAAVEKVIKALPSLFMEAEGYLDKTMDLETLITTKMRAMDVADFEQILHPIFQEDEWILILVGGLLGFAVGMTQWYALGS